MRIPAASHQTAALLACPRTVLFPSLQCVYYILFSTGLSRGNFTILRFPGRIRHAFDTTCSRIRSRPAPGAATW